MKEQKGKIVWGASGEKKFTTGIKHGVLYPVDDNGKYSQGYAWNGLTSVTESPSGAEITSLYADDEKYVNLISAEEFGGTIEAYWSPKEFDECDGQAEIAPGITISQQDRKTFGLCYTTTIGNDAKSTAYGYELHLVYGCLAQPSERNLQTINDNPEASSLSWEFKSTPVAVAGHKSCSVLKIDSTTVDPDTLAKLEAILFGTDETSLGADDATAPRLPLPDEILDIIAKG